MTESPFARGFKGRATLAGAAVIAAIAAKIKVEEAVLRAVLRVEAPRGPFDERGRPTILYEGHVFWRNLPVELREEANRQGLAWPHWDRTRYPKGGQDPMYAALARACEIDEAAALKACSWGSPQILGENHAMVGFATVEAMVVAFMDSEDAQIGALAAYIDAANLEIQLRAKDWAGFAQVYNGPGYATHRYDERLAEAYAELAPPPPVADPAPSAASPAPAPAPAPPSRQRQTPPPRRETAPDGEGAGGGVGA
jgi:hypothetical protein